MISPLSLVAAVTPSDDPTLRPGLDPASVTPGTLGFVATLFIVVLVIFLIRDMVKRIRRVRYAAEVEQAREQRGAADAVRDAGEQPGSAARGPAGDARDDSGRTGGGVGDVPRPGGTHGPDNR